MDPQGTQNFGGIRVGNGPTEDEAGIIEHDQLALNTEEEPEVRRPSPPAATRPKPSQTPASGDVGDLGRQSTTEMAR